MFYTQHFCVKCGSEHIQRNGTSQSHAKYQCKSCGYQARFTPAVAKATQYAQVDKLFVERNSQRSIVRATGVVVAASVTRTPVSV
jgi:DNA-directed RNA polymerase subunit M/transcription elongation factor TFIIS